MPRATRQSEKETTERSGRTETGVDPLPVDVLYRRCDPDALGFSTTDELEPLEGILGQPRASSAVRFGIGIEKEGFNIYALGPDDADKETLVRHFLAERAAGEPTPEDLCYVNNFEDSRRPRVLRLPAGTGCELSRDLDRTLEELEAALRAAFDSEEYQTRRQAIEEEVGEEQEEALGELRDRARERDLRLLRTPAGFAFAPTRDGEPISRDELQRLSEEEREEFEAKIEALQEELQGILRQVPRRQREVRERVRELNREVARYAVRDLFEELREACADFPDVRKHLEAIEDDIVDNVEAVAGSDGDSAPRPPGAPALGALPEGGILRRYRINVVVDCSDAEHAPVVYEDHPTYQNLLGRVEHLPVMGALVTDFNLIRPGALHRANGGYLVLDVRRILVQPFAWDGLKRALGSGEIRIESPREALGLASTVSLEPEPAALDVKVVLLGDRLLYYLLAELDPDFPDLFKVAADFAEEMDRDDGSEASYARLIAALGREEDLLPFEAAAVARVIERSSRLVGDAEKLSVRTRGVLDLLREASYWAGDDGAEAVSAAHVQKAIDEWTYRSDRLREKVQERILRETLYIDTEGEAVGQVNGLSVIRLGGFAFGRPNRITARVSVGRGELTDIEREVELGGPIHSKGVLILQGFLNGRYAGEHPLSLAASLVFEQSYGGIEGDSASSAELYALLSAVGEVPLRQSVAVTGSVNQHGQVQPIGGVNEKVEGFFDICEARGLSGDQGVILPAANVKHLMLREDVREAVAEDRFHVWAVETVDQGMEILTGTPMGAAREDGTYPGGTVNGRVARRLSELAESRKEFVRALEDTLS